MNNLDDELTRALHQRADNLSSTPLAFDDVRGKATSIRRRRQLASGLGVAAAIAVIVPTAMFATQGNDSSPQPATATPTVTDTNTPSATSTPVMGSDPLALDVSDLPTGAPPELIYLPTSEGVTSFAMVGDRSVRVINGGVTITTEMSDQVFGPYPTSFGIAVNSAGTAAAWTTDDGDVMAYVGGETDPFVLMHSGLASLQVAAITGTDCVRGKASDCTYFVSGYNTKTNANESFTINGDGGLGKVDPDGLIIKVLDATDDGRVVGQTDILDAGSCSAVLEPATSGSRPVFETCGYTLEAFSPSGRYVLATDPYHDGAGSGLIGVYGDNELQFSLLRKGQDQAYFAEAVWEDDAHVLFTAYQDGAWSIVRASLDGAMEYAVPPVKGDAFAPMYHFQTR